MSSDQRKQSVNDASDVIQSDTVYGFDADTALRICSGELEKLKEELQLVCLSVELLLNPIKAEEIGKMTGSETDNMVELEASLKDQRAGKCPICQASDIGNETVESRPRLQKKLIQLKAELTAENKKVLTLITMLKSNNDTFEKLIGDVKYKNENQKMKNEAILKLAKLQNGLKEIKDRTTAFLSERAIYITRLEDSASREDELKRQLAVAEKDRNLLLHLVVQQQPNLTMNKLEELLKLWNSSNTAQEGGGDAVQLSGITLETVLKASESDGLTVTIDNQCNESVKNLSDAPQTVTGCSRQVRDGPDDLITEGVDILLNNSDDAPSTVPIELEKMEEQMQRMHTSVVHLEYLAKSCNEITKIAENETVQDRQITNLDDKIEFAATLKDEKAEIYSVRQASFSDDKKLARQVLDLQKEVFRLKCRLSAKREKIATVQKTIFSNMIISDKLLKHFSKKLESENTVLKKSLEKHELLREKIANISLSEIEIMIAQFEMKTIYDNVKNERQLAIFEENHEILALIRHLADQQGLCLRMLTGIKADWKMRNTMRRSGKST